jgi:hypothetical protein
MCTGDVFYTTVLNKDLKFENKLLNDLDISIEVFRRPQGRGIIKLFIMNYSKEQLLDRANSMSCLSYWTENKIIVIFIK